jgi:hypothetical protein
MLITTDDFVKIALTLSICFALVGIAVQIMRMMGSMNETIKESNLIIKLGHDFLEKFSEDYDYIIDQVKNILDGVSGISEAILGPLANIFGFLKKFENMPFVGKKKAHKQAKAEESEFEAE